MLEIMFFISMMIILAVLRSKSYFGNTRGKYAFGEVLILLAGWAVWSFFLKADYRVAWFALFWGWIYLIYPLAYLFLRQNLAAFAGKKIHAFPNDRSRHRMMFILFSIMALVYGYFVFIQQEGRGIAPYILLAELFISAILSLVFLRTDAEIYENGILLPEKILHSWQGLNEYKFIHTGKPAPREFVFRLRIGWRSFDIFTCSNEERAELETFLSGKIGQKDDEDN